MPTMLATSRERSSAPTTALPISPVGPVTATVRRAGGTERAAMATFVSHRAPPYAWDRGRPARLNLDRSQPHRLLRRRLAVLRRTGGGPLAATPARARLLRPEPDAARARLLQQPARRLPRRSVSVLAHLGRLLRCRRLQQRRPGPRRRRHQALSNALLDPRIAIPHRRGRLLRRVHLRRHRRRAGARLRLHPGRLPQASQLLETQLF